MLKRFACAILCLGLLACGSEPAPATEEPMNSPDNANSVHVVSEMLARSEDGRVVIDLRDTEDRFLIEKSVDYSAIHIICPGGRVMNLERWVPELAFEFKVAPSQLKHGFLMYTSSASTRNEVEQMAPVCQMGCYAHFETGTWTCFCPGEG
jgi:hypothetical protein